MDWNQRLKSLVVDSRQRGRIRVKLIFTDAESRRMLFDDNDAAVQASLLALIEPAAAARSFSIAEQNAIAHDAQIGTSHPSVIVDTTYEGDYKPGDSQVKLPCQHAFHQACGAEWLLNYSKLCPVCKHDITDAATVASSSV